MATFDELRLQELLKSFNNQSDNTGITSIDKDYTDPKYTYDGLYQDNYEGYDENSNRMFPTMDPYGYIAGTGTRQASESSAFPFNKFGTESTFAPRVGILPVNNVPQINNQILPQNFEFLQSAYEDLDEDAAQVDSLPGQKKKLSDMGRNFGISSLIGMITGNPIIGLLSRGMKGLGALNDKMQNSDFGQSKNLMDYLDMRKYGGAQGRRDFSARNMAQARGITKSLASRPSSTSGGYQRGPGGSGAQSQSQAGPGFSGSGSASEMGSF